MEFRTQDPGVRSVGHLYQTPYLLAIIVVMSCICCLSAPVAGGQSFSGGTGEPNDPYQIATAEQLLSIGSDPNLLDRHFVLVADIDLDPRLLPGGKPFTLAPIAPIMPTREVTSGGAFTGVFDGCGHTISHLTVVSGMEVGLFGRLGAGAQVMDLGIADANITGGSYVGGLAGRNEGYVIRCSSTGIIGGHANSIGGLVGWNEGTINQCTSAIAVKGTGQAGGLVGNNEGQLAWCSAHGPVQAGSGSFSTNPAGGLVAYNTGPIACCFSTGKVSGTGQYAGGLVGSNSGNVFSCLWDTQASGKAASAAGRGLTTAQMQDIQTFLAAGWDLAGETANGTSEIWQMPLQGGYPVLSILHGYVPRSLQGQGTMDDPYLIADACDLGAVVHYNADAHYRLAAAIDLAGTHWATAVIPHLSGVFDGNGLSISRLTITGGDGLGLFGELTSSGEVRDLMMWDVNIAATGSCIGGLIGSNQGEVTGCSSIGIVAGAGQKVGGLVGYNQGHLSRCHTERAVLCTGSERMSSGFGGLVGWNSGDVFASYSIAAVSGSDSAGGLVGYHDTGTLSQCSSIGSVSGGYAGGLAALSSGRIVDCCSGSRVSGAHAGGLVAANGGPIMRCYSTGPVSCTSAGNPAYVGGLIGSNGGRGLVTQCFWDVQASSQASSIEGTGKTTIQMQDMQTYLAAGWDFVGETANGTHEVWQMPEPGGYPALAILNGYTPRPLQGLGTAEEPYLIASAGDLGAVLYYSPNACYRLAVSIDLSGIHWGSAVIPEFAGTFDGNGMAISGLTISGRDSVGLFGKASGKIQNLRLLDVNVVATDDYAGSLAGSSAATVEQCTATGIVSGNTRVGGLIGANTGSVLRSGYAGDVLSGKQSAGGLIGENRGPVSLCASSGDVRGDAKVGGLAGWSNADLTCCYSTAAVTGTGLDVAGLAGSSSGTVHQCYSTGQVSGGPWNHGGLVVGYVRSSVTASFWDTQTSAQTYSDGGIGLPTAQMQSAGTFVNAGWDFADVWMICEGKDYPRLRWEGMTCGE